MYTIESYKNTLLYILYNEMDFGCMYFNLFNKSKIIFKVYGSRRISRSY